MISMLKKGLMAIAILAIGYSATAQIGGAVLSKVKKGITPNKHIEDDGITGAIHEKYVNQIVWSNSKISKETPDESAFKNKFNAGEKIYGRYYLSESLQNFIFKEKRQEESSFSFYFDVYIDGVKQDVMFNQTNIGYDYCKATTWQIWVHIPRTKDEFGSSDDWVDMVNKAMTPGEHTVKFDLKVVGYEGVAVSGGFTYVKGTDKVKYGWNLDSYTTGMTDATLEAGILKCIQSHAANSGWKEKFTKVKIKSADWYTLYHEISGVIIGRTLNAYCLATWPDGHCTVQLFTFSQDYTGSGYSKSFSLYSVGDQEVADCD